MPTEPDWNFIKAFPGGLESEPAQENDTLKNYLSFGNAAEAFWNTYQFQIGIDLDITIERPSPLTTVRYDINTTQTFGGPNSSWAIQTPRGRRGGVVSEFFQTKSGLNFTRYLNGNPSTSSFNLQFGLKTKTVSSALEWPLNLASVFLGSGSFDACITYHFKCGGIGSTPFALQPSDQVSAPTGYRKYHTFSSLLNGGISEFTFWTPLNDAYSVSSVASDSISFSREDYSYS